MDTKWVMEITKTDESILKMESHYKEALMSKARIYHKKHPDYKIRIYEVKCIFARETIQL